MLRELGKRFFFEKKNQKTFIGFGLEGFTSRSELKKFFCRSGGPVLFVHKKKSFLPYLPIVPTIYRGVTFMTPR
jgi:hypothetical protein